MGIEAIMEIVFMSAGATAFLFSPFIFRKKWPGAAWGIFIFLTFSIGLGFIVQPLGTVESIASFIPTFAAFWAGVCVIIGKTFRVFRTWQKKRKETQPSEVDA